MEATSPDSPAVSTYRTTPSPPGSSAALIEREAPILSPLLASSPHPSSPDLKIYTPSDPTFKTLNTYFHLDLSAQPLAIVRPTSIDQVSHIISFATRNAIPFTVRCGGHDSWGRSAVSGALTIDLRELDEITLSSDHKSVRIGGGVISGNLTSFLAPYGLVAVQGGCSSVGYTNWAATGGYGTLNGRFGMGCDQIVGARIVNAKGEVVDADGLMGLMAIPGVGTVLMFMFNWASEDLAAGWQFLEKIRGLGKVVMDTVKESKSYDPPNSLRLH
jgi:hypothetical protein